MSKPMRVFVSGLTGRAYATSTYRDDGGGRMVSTGVKHDVTADVVEHLMAQAWARGWNECNAAAEGEAPSNPYRRSTAAEAVTVAAASEEMGA